MKLAAYFLFMRHKKNHSKLMEWFMALRKMDNELIV